MMRFRLPVDHLDDSVLQHAYMSGYERVPWNATLRVADGELVVDRITADSGSLHVPWSVEGHGALMLATGTLQEQAKPYALPLELARGKLAQVRNQSAEWIAAGLIPEDTARAETVAATRLFGQAIGSHEDFARSAQLAGQSLKASLDAAHLLTTALVGKQLGAEGRVPGRLPGLLGVDLGRTLLDETVSEGVLGVANAALVPAVWKEVESNEGTFDWSIVDKQVEWCRRHHLRVCVGPILNFDTRSLPDWLALYEQDYYSFLSLACEFVRAVVQRYRGCVDLWVCAGRVNTGEVLSLTDEHRVRATARVVQETRQIDEKTPLVVSFDQPWGEYLTRGRDDYPPMHFADVLLRADLGISGVMLEINAVGPPHGSMPRDALELSRHLDYWGLLGTPIFLSLSAPGLGRADPLAMRQSAVGVGDWTLEAQARWAARNVPLGLAKPNVQGVFWNQLRDVEPHDHAHSGLFDLQRKPRPVLRELGDIKRRYVQ